MERKIPKCSSEKHKEIDAFFYCEDCKIYMCNKCNIYHSELFKNHRLYNDYNNSNNNFTGLCLEKNHFNELKYFCKNHNKLCCISCISKIKDNEIGQHRDCDIYYLENIKEEKVKELKKNSQYLEDILNDLNSSNQELEIFFQKINNDKENIKKNIQKTFTKIRNLIHQKEDELLMLVDNIFDNLFCNENKMKEYKNLRNKINNMSKEIKIINEKKNKNLIIFINDCINIEKNIKEINKADEIIKKCQLNYNNIKFKKDLDENEINDLIQAIKFFGKKSIEAMYVNKKLSEINEYKKIF